MKKYGFYLTSFLLSVFLLTSCVEGGGNTQEAIGFGLLDYGGKNGYTPVIKCPNSHIYSPTLLTLINSGKLNIGSSYLFYYRIDYDQPDNAASVIEANGYQTISLLNIAELATYYLNERLTNINSMFPDELTIINGCDGVSFIDNHLFVIQTIAHPDDWNLTWDMSYDGSEITPTEVYDKRYYDVFVRARAIEKTDNKEYIEVQYVNVYYVHDFLAKIAHKEESYLGSSYNKEKQSFEVRFNFIKDVDKETDEIIWESSIVSFNVFQFAALYTGSNSDD